MTISRQLISDSNKSNKHTFISDTDSSDGSDKDGLSWIDNFLCQPGSEWFCQIPEAYLNDGFNLYGLESSECHGKLAYKQLLGGTDSSDSFDSDSEDEIEKETEHLYGLIHARFIFSEEGLFQMIKKFREGVFGLCPRLSCNGTHLLPIGLNDKPNKSNVKLYCFKCQQLYNPDAVHEMIDGAYFTRSFPQYLLMELSLLEKDSNENSLLTSESMSTTRNGFK
ncbi:Casein kinase II regulatory subunit family protein [Trichomonas vaginalis G3]|uniref:Casein kinase II subunit beta n=1 Tax=Trichomonas vaginalis (strain ATCC PRA-98 / G3) TaxID=412133 RepID=A2E314_TRIV3|nr:protein kinase regulator protein [Trichomonas vaginalis G3]EAY12950.1 Casein kinase II regulatory subunit family protein [Trichomonas vaginalis G3]KAI5499762.1 protein kinase regulator protein [Trichomonas vaginalis G3]|eukprot:XP_001325173.1 Casein kinase II regulatory subunit family protein [Trichomonas vaginalis G3]